MHTVARINWQPIANLPEDRKDGRLILIWAADPFIAEWPYYDNPFRDGPGWEQVPGRTVIEGVTHWADVTAAE